MRLFAPTTFLIMSSHHQVSLREFLLFDQPQTSLVVLRTLFQNSLSSKSSGIEPCEANNFPLSHSNPPIYQDHGTSRPVFLGKKALEVGSELQLSDLKLVPGHTPATYVPIHILFIQSNVLPEWNKDQCFL